MKKLFETQNVSSVTDALKHMIANILILLTAALTVIYAGACVYAYLMADSMIFPAPAKNYQDGPEIIKLKSDDGETISAYFLEAPGSEKLLFYSHGNGEDLGDIRPFLEEFQRRGISVLAYDYPGYGTSTGRPSETGVFNAAEAAYQYALSELNFSPQKIVLYGRSLGSGPSCWLAERYPVDGLVMDGAFTSTFRVMTHIKLLPWDIFDNLKRISKIDSRILLMHGKRDTTVPFSHALKNYDRAKKKEAEWVESGHNDLVEVMGEEYWKLVLRFIHGES
ncbi:MAG: alpha/beta hydrolase [Verrucomicrobiota bacterium]